MVERAINGKLCIRTDTAGNWQKANPVLLRGEIGFEEDNGKIKIGDGKTRWNSLPYFAVGMTKEQIRETFFPVNSIRVIAGDENPADGLGGEWEELTEEELPSLKYWVRRK